MAQIVWTEPALAELDAIADYIALDKPDAARRLVRRILAAVAKLEYFPSLGSRVPELPKSIYRQLVVKPCRIFYRHEAERLFIVFVMRNERLLRKEFLK
jgi:toxin ParE1/3/4